ncbi:MAG: deoxyguanosinetriphosphate triphosphohydrolase [Acidobacteriota bacterium]
MQPSQALAPYAMTDARSRGRHHPEPEHAFRSLFQRDRDRIVHSRAFRRLEYKTQVFINHEGDHYRTRLTHSLEVSLIGRTVCRALRLNEDLVESLALSHDLGHTPFGHLGEDVLDELMADEGGFNHNRQSLRIVEVLEDRYPDFPGLNLTWEVREGIAKHSGRIDPARSPECARYEPDVSPPIEAQMVDLVDEIAYNHHDIADGLESGRLPLERLTAEVALFGEFHRLSRTAYPTATPFQIQAMTLRGLINCLVTDLVSTTGETLKAAGIQDLNDVRSHADPLVGLSRDMARKNLELKQFLRQRLYHHPRMEQTRDRYRSVLRALWEAYTSTPDTLPPAHRDRIDAGTGASRVIADYIAGMTDRYALEEYRRLHDVDPLAGDGLPAA